ncbi:MAG: transposase [Ignavibacteriae bacterium]|nr:transposase [Ignavibacteriota bacterium]
MIKVSDILSGSLNKYLIDHKLSYKQKKVINKIINCFSENSKQMHFVCSNEKCDYDEYKPQPCRDRHCNRCNNNKKIKWLINLLRNHLPLPYYHIVFTLPSELNNLAICNQKILYDIFFKSSFYVLNKFSQDEKYFGGKLGYIGLLHTWGQKLDYHPHLHFIVMAGGIKGNTYKKLPYQRKFIFPVLAMSKVMMGKFIELLKEKYNEGKLNFPGKLEPIEKEKDFNKYLFELSKKSWVIYTKAPLPNSERTLEYISRYSHKVAISNGRIKSYNEGKVSFVYNDYNEEDEKGIAKRKVIKITDIEFIRRYVLHILPEGFRKIRYGGIFSSNQKSDAIRIIMNCIKDELKKLIENTENLLHDFEEEVKCFCPRCNHTVLVNGYG